MWRIRLIKNFFVVILLGGSIIFPTSVQVMSNHIYEKEVYPDFTEYQLFKNDDLLDSIAIPEVFEENEELQEDDPLWLEEIEEEEELIELPVPEDAQEEQKQEEERQQQENETQLDEESIESESGLTKEKILEEVQDEGIARELIPGARTLFSGQLGSIPWVVDAQGKLILGSGVFDETNNIGGRYAATDYFNHPMYSQAITSVQLTGPIALRELNGSLNISGDIRRGFFTDLRNVREIEGIEFLDTSGLREMSFMFANMSALTSLDVSGFDTSNVTNMQEMFQNMSSLTELDVSGFDTHNVWSMQGMFQNMSSLTELDVSGFDTSNVTDMSFMFHNVRNVTKLDVSGFDTSNVTDMHVMFEGVSSVTELDVSSFDTSNVINLSFMFHTVSSVTELDVSGFDTSNATTMAFMFHNMGNVTELDVSGFDTSNVMDLSFMFNEVSNVTELDVSGFDTSNVTTMAFMFHNVSNVTELDVSGFDTGNVTNMWRMFMGTSSLTKLDLSRFDTRNVTNMQGMFERIPLEQLILGSDFVFHSANGSPGLLPLSGSATHHPNWQNVGAGTVDEPKGNFVFTSAQLMANYDGSTMADTWVWQPRIFVNLTIEIEGQGTVTPNTTTSIERGGMIDISATPELGWRFSHWRIESGEGTITDIDQSTTTFAIGDEDTKLVAVFEDLGELLSVRIPTSAVFNTTSKSGHRDIVAPDYAIGNESPFAVSVNVVAPTELKNMNIIEELNVVGDGKENLLIRKGNSHQTEPFRLFDLAVEEANTFTFTGIAEKLSEESSHITPTFNMILRFIPNL